MWHGYFSCFNHISRECNDSYAPTYLSGYLTFARCFRAKLKYGSGHAEGFSCNRKEYKLPDNRHGLELCGILDTNYSKR